MYLVKLKVRILQLLSISRKLFLNDTFVYGLAESKYFINITHTFCDMLYITKHG